jgi:hypothetical protein
MKKFSLKILSGYYDDWSIKVENLNFSEEKASSGIIKLIKINFLYQRDHYSVILKSVNENDDFKGQIISNGESVGTCFYTLYKNKTRWILFGDWIEDGECYKSTLELIV